MFSFKLRFQSAAALGLALIAFAPQAARASEEGPVPITETDDLADLHDRWVSAAEVMGVPGFSIAVVKDGRLYALDAHGFGGAGETRPVDVDTMFYIASITKTYTAFGLAKLAHEGKVDLDAPVKQYLPRFELADSKSAGSITVRDLLCHRPGINQGPIVMLDAYFGLITEDRFYHWMKKVTPTHRVTYTNVHFTLAGRVIEAVTGMSWKDYLQQGVFAPLGMDRTTAYASRMYADPNSAYPMVENDEGDWIETEQRKTDNVMHAAGGMGTTARDGARWIELFLNQGQVDGNEIVPRSVAEDALQIHSELPRPDGDIRRITGYGLAWQRGTYRGRPYAQHGGGYVGTAAHISFLPEDGLGVVVLCNSSPGGQALATVASIDIYDRLLDETDHQDLLPGYVRRCRDSSSERSTQLMVLSMEDAVTSKALGIDLERCTGTFANEHWGEIEFWSEAGELKARYGDMTLHLIMDEDTEGGMRAYQDGFSPVPLQFTRDQKGAIAGLTFQMDGQDLVYVRR